MIEALKMLGITILVSCSVFIAGMTIFIVKQMKWESNLKNYKAKDNGYVVNPYGFLLTTPKQLLDELQGKEM